MSGKWKIAAVSIASIVLITVNLYLIEKKESKVERTVFVENWTKVKKDTITETIQTNGVIKPVEEYDIYFDAKKNDFKKFLVKEGDAITAGSSLFEYTTSELDALKANLEAEKTAAEGEMAGIEEYIGKLRSYQGTVTSEPEAVIDESVEKNLNIDITTSSSDLIKSNIEQEMYKQELEKNRLDEKVKMLDAKLSSIEEQSSAIVTTSEADGVVKNINKNLNNPIISIVSTNMAIEGDFSEEEMKKAEVGMTIKASSSDSKKALKGTIGRIHSYPAEEPSLKKDNRFPFQALIDDPEGEETEPLLVGSKVNLTVITNEKAGVPSIPIEAVHYQKHPYIYKLTNKGHVDKHYITKGLKAEGKQEIIKGPAVGDVILVEPNVAVKNHSYFITPIQFEKVKVGTYKKFTSREKVRYLLLGILEK
jgi:HlyD family secretion protein